MASIQDFLGKFKKIVENEKVEKTLISKILSHKLGSLVKEDQIQVKNKTLYLKVNNYIKTEVLIKTDEILKEFRKNGIENILKIK